MFFSSDMFVMLPNTWGGPCYATGGFPLELAYMVDADVTEHMEQGGVGGCPLFTFLELAQVVAATEHMERDGVLNVH